MAKVGIIQRGWRGKAGGYSYSKGESGETIARASVTPANPRTTAMMTQRVIFATVANARKAFEQLISQSFEGKSAKQAKRLFTSLNVKLLRRAYANAVNAGSDFLDWLFAFTAKDISNIIPNPYVVSKGSLPNTTYGIKSTMYENSGEVYAGVRIGSVLQSGEFTIGDVSEGQRPVTVKVKTIMKTLYGIGNAKQQLNVVTIAPNPAITEPLYITGDGDEGEIIYANVFSCMRLVPNADMDFSSDLIIGYLDAEDKLHCTLNGSVEQFQTFFNQDKSDSLVFNNIARWTANKVIGSYEDGLIEIAVSPFEFVVDGGTCAAAIGIFTSEKTSKGMKCQSCTMSTHNMSAGGMNGLTMENAIASFKGQGVTIESESPFLEQGTDATSLPTD